METQITRQIKHMQKELYSLRKAAGLTQKQVAENLGITAQSYQAYEYGSAVPTLQNFIKLTILFDISANELLGTE